MGRRAQNVEELPTEDRSLHPTVVTYALHEMMKGRTPATAAKKTHKRLDGDFNMLLGPVIPKIDPVVLEEALWEHLTDLAIKTMGKFKEGKEDVALGSVVDLYSQGKPVEIKLRKRVIKKLGRDPFPPQQNPKRRRSAQRKNPTPWAVPLAVAGTALAMGATAFFGVRHFVTRKLSPKRPPRLEPSDVKPQTPKTWWETDLGTAMPAADLYPLGWDLDDVGFYDPIGGYRFAWRILKLRAPSDTCDPPCEWVLVVVGEGNGKKISGFFPTQTREQATDLLQAKHEEVS